MSRILLAANYNCSDSSSSAYGASNYGTCADDAETNNSVSGDTTASVGAPNTGFFQQVVSGGSFSIVLPLAVAVIAVAISIVVTHKNKKRSSN